MKTYVLTVSKTFPSYHAKAGQETDFIQLIARGHKLHTIRGNYELWKKRFEAIEKGEALLSVRQWTGVPYRSPQTELFKYYKSNGIGVQKLQLDILGWFVDDIDSDVKTKDIAENDGLSLDDFKEWFKETDMKEPMAIIHFTSFRY